MTGSDAHACVTKDWCENLHMVVVDELRCECNGDLVRDNHEGLGPMMGWSGPGPHSLVCLYKSDDKLSAIPHCKEYIHMHGKLSTDEWCTKCDNEIDYKLLNGQCIAKTELTEESVCKNLVVDGRCKNCYEYEGPLSENKKWTCGDCSTASGVFTDKQGSPDHLFELHTCERDDSAPPCQDSTDKSV